VMVQIPDQRPDQVGGGLMYDDRVCHGDLESIPETHGYVD